MIPPQNRASEDRPAKGRGKTLHQFLVAEVERILVCFGFRVAIEHKLPLKDGRVDYVDVLACRGKTVLACEVETTARHVVENACKADALGVAVWFVVPNEAVRSAVARRLGPTHGGTAGRRRILTLGGFPQAVSESFPLFVPANTLPESRETIPPRPGTAGTGEGR